MSRGVSQERALSQERETPFSGYGDRVGSGVAMAPSRWRGGELVTDPVLVTKSIKPRKMFYSPIGDGVVAADGVELKRLPPDLKPKVEVIQQRIVEKGDTGKAGLKLTEKTWSTGGGGESNIASRGVNYGGTPIPPDGRTSVASAPAKVSPSSLSDLGAGGPKPDDFSNLSNLVNAGPPPTAPKPAPAGPPYRSESADPFGSRSTLPEQAPTNGYAGSGYPASGRTSTTSALYEPGYRYEIKKDYQLTNPKELIHHYATTTPVTVIDPTIETTTRTITKQRFTQTIEEFGPFPPYKAGSDTTSPLKFARDLRDQTLTESQRRANQNAQPMSGKDSNMEQRIHEIRRSATSSGGATASEVDQLTERLASGLGVRRF